MDDQVNNNNRPGFAPDQMVKCQKCSKLNPPTRTDCFYCGNSLEIAQGNERLKLKRSEIWENSINLIVKSGEIDHAIVANLLSLDAENARAILESKHLLPIGRVLERSEAEHAILVFANHNTELFTVTDEDLLIKRLPKRIRRIDFNDEHISLTDFNTLEVINLDLDDVRLIVSGTIFKTRSDVVEVRARKVSTTKDQSDLSSDEMVIDIYTADEPCGYRISASGFDFSGLGENKAMLASENIRMLLLMLKEFALSATVNTNYNNVRRLLEHVWPLSENRDSRGIVKHGIGKMNMGLVKTSNNTEQFTRYSRLLNHIL